MARRRNSQGSPVSNTQPSTAARTGLWLGLALIGLTLLAYFPALSCGFIWDDDAHLTENPCIVGPLGFMDIWTIARARICPLVQSTFWLEYRIWGLNPLPYHLVNILMHGAAAVVLWRVLQQLAVPGAWLGAALWALHPVQVESVAWITEMKNTQSGLFFLLSILFFCKSRQAEMEGSPEARPTRDYILMLVFAALAMASKSSTVVLPVVLGLCAWWIDRGWRWRKNLVELTPLLVLSALTSVVTIWTQKAEGAFEPEFARELAERIAGVGKVVWFYAGKLAWPDPLIFVYPRWRIDASSITAWLPTLAIAGLMIVLWWQRDRWARSGFFAAGYFVAALLPVLGLVDTFFWRYSFVGDHFQYLASMSPLALAGAGISAGIATLRNPPRWLVHGIGSLLLATLGLLSWRQCGQYQNDEVLWSATLRLNSESWIAHNNLAIELARQPDRSAEAIFHYKEALRIRPNHAKALYNLAKVLERLPGRQDDAIAHYEETLRIDSELGWAHQNLAALLAASPDRKTDALAHFREALRLIPDSPDSHYNLAIELAKRPGNEAEILSLYREALRLRPDFIEAHYNLAIELAKQPGGAAEAGEHFEAVLRLRPEMPEAHNNYAMLLSTLPGRLPDSIVHYEVALRLRPDVARVHYNLAGAYYRAGRLAEAVRELETALQIEPGYEEARRNLMALREQMQN